MTEQLPAVIDRTKVVTGEVMHVVPALTAASGARASTRFLEFFAANIRNPHTRRAYGHAVAEFLAWCEDNGVRSVAAMQPLHVVAWIEMQTKERAAPTVKARLAAIRHLFDWLVTGQVVSVNPAGSVRGPSHTVTAGKTPVLSPAEARTLIDSIEVTTVVGLRDRARCSSFARVGVALGTKVEDVYTQNRRLWVGCARRVARRTPCHATITLRPISLLTSRAQVSTQIPRGRCSARSAAARAGRSALHLCPRPTPIGLSAGTPWRPASPPGSAITAFVRPGSRHI